MQRRIRKTKPSTSKTLAYFQHAFREVLVWSYSVSVVVFVCVWSFYLRFFKEFSFEMKKINIPFLGIRCQTVEVSWST